MNSIEIKENNLELRFAHLAPEVWEELGKIKRTGWIRRGVSNPETVQAHTVALRELAGRMFDSLGEFSEQDRTDILDMLEVHDWHEAIDGDEAIVTADQKERE